MSAGPPLTLGTAGHIDHGKTALIGALTGRDTDRLPEEHARGISIELGYAPLDLPGGRRLSVVDVPGHERFVRTMVAGATGIDLFLLCVAADDGVMPQTREHLAVLRGLGVGTGVVAITKADAADPGPASAEVAELLPGAEVVAVSAREGTGMDELLSALERNAAALPGRAAAAGAARLHVDRSFTLRGIGTVVTGTLWEGELAVGDRVRILPSGREARVRSVQVHDEPVASAAAGQRVALNLAGVARDEVARGDVVCARGAELAPSHRIHARLALRKPLPRGTRVQVHHGTREAPARVFARDDGPAQLRLESPLVAAAGDRLIVRQIAPPDTLGGGTVVDPPPRAAAEPAPVEVPPEPMVLDSAALRLAELLESDGDRPRTDPVLAEAAGLEAGDAAQALRALEAAGRAVRVGRSQHFAPGPLASLSAAVVALCEREGKATIASVRDELGTSRRYAQVLLEHLDSERVTRRVGDAHVARRAAPPAGPR